MFEHEDMEDKDFYLSVIRGIIDKEKSMLGGKVALAKARKAPLEISPKGEIDDFYGKGDQTVDILAQQLEDVAGKKVIDSGIRNYIKSEYDQEDYKKLPERLRPGYVPSSRESSQGFLSSLKSKLA